MLLGLGLVAIDLRAEAEEIGVHLDFEVVELQRNMLDRGLKAVERSIDARERSLDRHTDCDRCAEQDKRGEDQNVDQAAVGFGLL